MAVIDDPSGALVGCVATAVAPRAVTFSCDRLQAERAVLAYAESTGPPVVAAAGLDAELLADVDLVALRLPQSLAALDEIAEAIARHAAPGVRLVAGARTKHMTPAMNRVLRRHFASVRGSLGARKCRALLAEGPRPAEGDSSYPLREWDEDLQLSVCAHGGAFGGSSIDLGTRFLIGCFDRLPATARHIVDLGCGTGVLAVAVARRRPEAEVLAVDDSRSAVRSAIATAEANGLADRIRVDRRDGLEGLPDRSLDLVVCNPPFHRGPAKDSSAAYAMFADAGRALRPGGELWVVYNSHLPYRAELRRIGHTEIVAQNASFTVSRSVAS
ncbi:MAG TPA: class I SAM-dependent methyltransferase [Propionibacteriaceae bacterium]|nr:class I SAM-dependent methyltransferase [Propionibacteriaceae bacterium]